MMAIRRRMFRCAIAAAAFVSGWSIASVGSAQTNPAPSTGTPAGAGGFIDPDAPSEAVNAPPGPRRRAILIGVERYQPPGYATAPGAPVMFRNLKTPCRGVAEIEKKLHALKWRASTFDGSSLEENEVFSFCDKPIGEARELIETSIDELNDPDDLLIIYLAGHGARIGERNYFFKSMAKIDFARAAEAASINPRKPLFLGQSMNLEDAIIGNAELRYRGNILVILDTCRDDPLHKPLIDRIRAQVAAARKAANADADLPLPVLQPPSLDRGSSGIMFFYATTKGYQIADDAEQSGNSYMVRALLDGIKAGMPLTKIVTAAKERIISDTFDLGEGKMQTPSIAESINNTSICLAGCTLFAALDEKGRRDVSPIDRPVARPVPESSVRLAQSTIFGGNWLKQLKQNAVLRAAKRVDLRYKIFRESVPDSPDVQRNVEIYWCAGGTEEASRRTRAEALGQALGAATGAGFAGPGTMLGRVRSSALSLEDNDRAEFGVRNDAIRFDYGDPTPRAFGEAIRTLTTDMKVDSVRASASAPIPVFFCQGAVPKGPIGKLWIQAAREDQHAFATSLAGVVQHDMDDLYVAQTVQIIATSPERTQVRYFHPEDRATAEHIADTLFPSLGAKPDVVEVPKYASRVSPGLTELWLGKTLDVATVPGMASPAKPNEPLLH